MSSSTRKLGPWMLTALVAGNMIGSGVYSLPAILGQVGSISILAWIFTATGALLLALVFAKLSSVMPKTGGPYAYCREGFGEFVGFQMAYNYWIALWVGNAAIVVTFVSYLGVFFPSLHTNLLLGFFVSVSTLWLLTFINALGAHWAGMMQLVTTILKLAPLFLVGIGGLFFFKPELLSDFNVTHESNLTAFNGVATLVLWAFIGLESATVPAGSVENPKRNIPRATIIGTLLAALVYILSTTVIMGLIPMSELAHSTAPFADAANAMFGPIGKFLVAIGAVISCFGTLNGWILLQGQIPLAAAEDNLFPKKFAKVDARGTPIFGLIFTSVLVTGLLFLTLDKGLIEQFKFIISLAVLASLIPYLFTTMAEILIFNKNPALIKGERVTFSIIIAILACIYVFWALIGSGATTVFYGTFLFFSSVPVYAMMKYKSSSESKLSH
jgi:APA family basic amino acid/polyamine antiporter